MKTILFIGHDANRAGAQHLLLHVLTYLHQIGVRTGLVLGGDGPLLADYEQITTVYRAFSSPAPPAHGQRQKLRRALGLTPPANPPTTDLLAAIRADGYEIILSNTIANGGLLRALAPLGLPFTLYVHELESSIQVYTRPDELTYELTHARHVFCGSAAVRQNLLTQHGLLETRMSVLNSMIQIRTLLAKLSQVDRAGVRQALDIPADAVVVGGVGHAEWRKGVDLFLLVAQHVWRTHPGLYFVWVGVPETGEETRRLRYDLARMRMPDHVRLLPAGSHYLDYVACFDIFALTSREDPYPLVMLEAGLNHNPVLAFDGSGGSADYVGTDTGCLIPYLDIERMSLKIKKLVDNPAERSRLGNLFFDRATAHDAAQLVPQLLAQLAQIVAETLTPNP